MQLSSHRSVLQNESTAETLRGNACETFAAIAETRGETHAAERMQLTDAPATPQVQERALLEAMRLSELKKRALAAGADGAVGLDEGILSLYLESM